MLPSAFVLLRLLIAVGSDKVGAVVRLSGDVWLGRATAAPPLFSLPSFHSSIHVKGTQLVLCCVKQGDQNNKLEGSVIGENNRDV